MKIIAFYTGIYPDGFAPMAYRLHYYMKALLSKGVDVEIVMPTDKDETSNIFEGVPFSFVKVSKPKRFNESRIIKEYAKICALLAVNCDAVLITNRENNYIQKVSESIHAVGGKIVVEINENPYSIFGSRLDTAFSLFLKRQYFLMKTVKRVDGVIVISELLHELISMYKSKNAPIVKIPILTGSRYIEREKTYDGIPYILHAGALSEQKDGVKAMLQAFQLAHKELNGNLRFVFTSNTGFHSLKRWIYNYIKKNNLGKNISFEGLVSTNELEKLYNNCSLAIINKPINSQNKYNFPTKLTELLPREIPVIVSRTGELAKYFVDMENAFVVDANSINQIAKKIVYVQSNPKQASKIARNGRLLAEEKFFYLHHAEQLYNFFTQIIKK
jgi:glycosyltransferase involved in cell wall biosynthesis